MSRTSNLLCVAISESIADDLDPQGWERSKALWTFRDARGLRRRHGRHDHLVVARLEEVTRELIRAFADLGGGRTSYMLLLGDLPLQALSERIAHLRVGDPQRLHLSRARSTLEERDLVQRLVRLHARQGSDRVIFDAWWEHDTLVALSPRFQRVRVPEAKLFEAVPALSRLSRKKLTSPTVHPDGSYLHWEAADVHLGWDQLNEIVDVRARLRAVQGRRAFRRRHGAAIREVRAEHGLSQQDVEGLTARHLRRIEHGEQQLTHKAMTALARAHEMTPGEYLEAVAQHMPEGP